MEKEIKGNAFVGSTAWMYLWDENSMVSGNAGGDWWTITSGEQTPVLNEWGRLAAGQR